MTSAMASGGTQRLWSALGMSWRFWGVSMVPGKTQLTFMFFCLSSAAMLSTKRTMALLETL
jgi:hypothetical protein